MLEIYSLGDSKLMFETLMALQMMFSSDNYMGIIKTALIIGMLFATLGAAFGGSPWAAGESIMKGGLSVGPWSMIMPVTLATIMTVPTYDFMVSDAYDGAMAYPPVTLPAVVGMPMAITSQVGKLISEEFEQAFGSVVDSERMTKAGFLNSIFVNDSLRDLNLKRVPAGYNNLDYDLDRSIQRYYIDCLTIELESIFPPPKITYQALNASSDLIGMFSYGAFANIDTVMSLTKTGTGSSGGSGSSDVVMTCGQAYALLVTELADTNIEATFGDSIKNIVFRKPLPGTATSALQNTLDAVAPGAITAGRMMTNRVMAHALQQAHVKHASLMGGNGAGMASVLINSEMVKNAKFITEKLLFDRYVRPFMTFVEIFALAMSPLIPFFVLIGSLKALTGWLMMTAWIALWAPILTIINYFILYKVRGELTAYTDGLTANGVYVTDYFTTINGYAYFAGVTNEWLALGSMLASTTPALAMGILTGTMAGLSGAAGAMSKSEQGTNFTGVAPTPIDGAALHRAEPSKIHNETLGSARSGFFEQSAKMNFGESFGNSAGRAREASSTANENLSKATANLLKAGLGSQDGKTFLSDVGGEVKQSTSRSFGASKKYAEAFENSKSIGADYKKEVAALAALSATAGGRFNMLGFKAGLEGIMTRKNANQATRDEMLKASESIVNGVTLTDDDKKSVDGADFKSWKSDKLKSLAKSTNSESSVGYTQAESIATSAAQKLTDSEQRAKQFAGSETKHAFDAVAGTNDEGKKMLYQVLNGNDAIGKKARQNNEDWARQSQSNNLSPLAGAYYALFQAASGDGPDSADAQAKLASVASKGGFVTSVQPSSSDPSANKVQLGQQMDQLRQAQDGASEIKSVANAGNAAVLNPTSKDDATVLGSPAGAAVAAAMKGQTPKPLAAASSPKVVSTGAPVGASQTGGNVGGGHAEQTAQPSAVNAGAANSPKVVSTGAPVGASQTGGNVGGGHAGDVKTGGKTAQMPVVPKNSGGSDDIFASGRPSALKTPYTGMKFNTLNGTGILDRGKAAFDALPTWGKERISTAVNTPDDLKKQVVGNGQYLQDGINNGLVVGGYEDYANKPSNSPQSPEEAPASTVKDKPDSAHNKGPHRGSGKNGSKINNVPKESTAPVGDYAKLSKIATDDKGKSNAANTALATARAKLEEYDKTHNSNDKSGVNLLKGSQSKNMPPLGSEAFKKALDEQLKNEQKPGQDERNALVRDVQAKEAAATTAKTTADTSAKNAETAKPKPLTEAQIIEQRQNEEAKKQKDTKDTYKPGTSAVDHVEKGMGTSPARTPLDPELAAKNKAAVNAQADANEKRVDQEAVGNVGKVAAGSVAIAKDGAEKVGNWVKDDPVEAALAVATVVSLASGVGSIGAAGTAMFSKAFLQTVGSQLLKKDAQGAVSKIMGQILTSKPGAVTAAMEKTASIKGVEAAEAIMHAVKGTKATPKDLYKLIGGKSEESRVAELAASIRKTMKPGAANKGNGNGGGSLTSREGHRPNNNP